MKLNFRFSYKTVLTFNFMHDTLFAKLIFMPRIISQVIFNVNMKLACFR